MIRSAARKSQFRSFVAVFSAMLITLFFVWTRLQNIRIKREIGRLNKHERELKLEQNQLKLKWAKLTELKNLEKMGLKKYGLRRPTPQQVIMLREP